MEVFTREAVRSRVCRRREAGREHVSIAHEGWLEHFITLSPLSGETPSALMSRLGALLGDEDVTVLKLTILGACAARDEALRALCGICGAEEWPITWVEGMDCARRPIAGVQVHGISRSPVETLWLDGRPVGRVFEDREARYAVLADVRPADASDARPEQAYAALHAADRALQLAGFSFDDVARTWLFVDRILDWYAALNTARHRFFAELGLQHRLAPASTGIGAANPWGLAMVAEAFAVRRHDGTPATIPLDSPLQGPAPAYGSAFSRAVEVDSGGCRRVLISGTAAIDPDGRSAHPGDVVSQVELTLQVVEALLCSRGMGFEDVTRAIAYFKHASDARALDRYKAGTLLAALPLVAVEADVCRDELLFEIEVDAVA